MRNADQPDANEPPAYAVRFTEAMRSEIDTEYVRLAGISGVDIADDWENRLLEAIRKLATYPERRAKAAENEMFQRVHPGAVLYVLTYQRSRRSPTWRILFTVHEADALDPPKVLLRHLWHGAREPVTSWPADDE